MSKTWVRDDSNVNREFKPPLWVRDDANVNRKPKSIWARDDAAVNRKIFSGVDATVTISYHLWNGPSNSSASIYFNPDGSGGLTFSCTRKNSYEEVEFNIGVAFNEPGMSVIGETVIQINQLQGTVSGGNANGFGTLHLSANGKAIANISWGQTVSGNYSKNAGDAMSVDVCNVQIFLDSEATSTATGTKTLTWGAGAWTLFGKNITNINVVNLGAV